MFLFKKFAAPLLFPLSLCIEFFLIGFIFLFFTKKQRVARFFLLSGFLILLVFSNEFISESLLRSLEDDYPPLLNLESYQEVKWVILLGAGHTSDADLPPISQVSETALVRLIEGIRLLRELPQSTLILSGGSVFDPEPHAHILKRIALTLGVDENRLLIEDRSRDTKDEAIIIKEIVGSEPCILVTSASHIPRAMMLFEGQNMQPIAAPVGHWVKKRKELTPSYFIPNPQSLRKSQRAFYEYLGIIWAWLRGLI